MQNENRVSRRRIIQNASAIALATSGVHADAGVGQGTPRPADPRDDGDNGFVEPESTFFSTAFVESAESLDTDSDGDLWPCAWADDGHVYLLNGDGYGFDRSQLFSDIVMNRISGTPENGITGERLAAGADIAPIWGDPATYNRKPTGIVAVDGDGDGHDELYAAVQDLRYGTGAFDDAPNASITVSRDYGRTWQPTTEPMFTDHVFTTIFFLDYGQSNQAAKALGPDGTDYVYAYGLDFNWRDSFTNAVEDPTDLYLARVPVASIQDRATWAFFAGIDGDTPRWDTDIANRTPVLTEARRVYPTLRQIGIHDMTVISQGSVVYNQPLDRYIYTSWTEYTFEFFEAPQPWGPWKRFLRKDFGGYPWFGGDAGCETPKNGGYATVVPSRFISDDGRTMWVQANWFVGVGCGTPNYNFSLRQIRLEPFVATVPANEADAGRNLAMTEEGVTPIEKSTHFGLEEIYNDGATDRSEDSLDFQDKPVDFWGYTWPRAYTVNRVVYTTGEIRPNGGWFAGDLRVQLRRDFEWHDVSGIAISPDYPFDETTAPFTAFTLTFDESWGDGVRIIGAPGGTGFYTSISELEVYRGPT